MWHLLWDLLLVSLGAGIGVVLMCILVVGKQADRTQIDRKNERRNKE